MAKMSSKLSEMYHLEKNPSTGEKKYFPVVEGMTSKVPSQTATGAIMRASVLKDRLNSLRKAQRDLEDDANYLGAVWAEDN